MRVGGGRAGQLMIPAGPEVPRGRMKGDPPAANCKEGTAPVTLMGCSRTAPMAMRVRVLLATQRVPVECRGVSGASLGTNSEGPTGPCCGLPVALINPGSVPMTARVTTKRMLAR